jgi:hypothetical protein
MVNRVGSAAAAATLVVLAPLFVGNRGRARSRPFPDNNGDGRVDAVITIAEGLFQQNGVAFDNGSLYVAEVDRAVSYEVFVGGC